MTQPSTDVGNPDPLPEQAGDAANQGQEATRKEYGGPPGKEPTRYGDWEKNGRCIDF